MQTKDEETKDILDNYLSRDTDEKEDHCATDYLKSILYVNKIRNIIDNKVSDRNKSIDELFKLVFDTFDNAKVQVKDELKDIVARAHNNFGIYYLNEGLYDEAEVQFKKGVCNYSLNETVAMSLFIVCLCSL
ncbi:hypothetical protein [Candidatus Nitrosocosmicus sp. R]